jgi:glycosyltransferase involved in cell wall biosynthesis
MHLLVDVQSLQTPGSRQRGIGRYTRNFIAALAVVRPDWRIELVQSAHMQPVESTIFPGLPCHTFTPPFPFVFDHNEANEHYYADWLTAHGADTILVTSIFERMAVVPRFCGPRPRLVGILYDLIPLLFADHYLDEPSCLAYYAHRFRQMLQFDGLLAISQATADDLQRLLRPPFPEVVSIAGASDPAFAPHAPGELDRYRRELADKFDLRRDFILYVGGFDFRKNLHGAMRAFACLPPSAREGLDLVLACELSAAQREILEGWGRELGMSGSLKLTGFVSDEELRALYQMCRVFFFPSIYEGLGLPVIEALQCGAPVVASSASSIPEFAGPVSWLADPADPEEMAGALQAALAEPHGQRLAERLAFASEFRWEKCAEHGARILERPAPSVRPQVRRPRLAWVSPLPPTRSGISDYSAELIELLSSLYEIDLVVDPSQPIVTENLAKHHLVLTPREAIDRHAVCPYDLFIYHLGNSPFHVYMLELLWRFPGLMVLHDHSLGALVLSACEVQRVWPTTLADELEHEGQSDFAASMRGRPVTDWDAIIDRSPLNRRLLRAAEAVIVHSAWSWRQVRKLVDVPLAHVPMSISMPDPSSRAAERLRLGLSEDDFVVCSLGLVGPAKRIEALLHGVAQLPASIRAHTIVAIVGEIAPSLQEPYAALAEQLGLTGLVRWVGRVPMRDFAAYARAADACVQLRYPTRGETSAALYRALSVGATCIVSDQGPMGDIPDSAVLKVRTPEHEIADLTAHLQHLHDNPAVRESLGQGALRYVAEQHHPEDVARKYAAVIELTIQQRSSELPWAEQAGAALEKCSDPARAAAAIEPWVQLRMRGQQTLRASHEPAEAPTLPRRQKLSA